jgi:hypothetical protein
MIRLTMSGGQHFLYCSDHRTMTDSAATTVDITAKALQHVRDHHANSTRKVEFSMQAAQVEDLLFR